MRIIFNLNIFSCTLRHHHSCCVFMLLHIDFSRTDKWFSLWRLDTSAYGCIIYLFIYSSIFSAGLFCSVISSAQWTFMWNIISSLLSKWFHAGREVIKGNKMVHWHTCFLFLIFRKNTNTLSHSHKFSKTHYQLIFLNLFSVYSIRV